MSVARVRPGSRATFVRAKVAKTCDAPPGLIGLIGREVGGDGLTPVLTQARQEKERPIIGTGGRRQIIGDKILAGLVAVYFSVLPGFAQLGVGVLN